MNLLKEIPKDRGFDHSLQLLNEGYLFIKNRCNRLGTDVFQTRFFGVPVICMSGEGAAKIFYDKDRFQRKGAALKRIQKTLFGENGIQTLDGQQHAHRKRLFMSFMTPERLKDLNQLMEKELESHLNRWTKQKRIVFFDEMKQILTKVACEWSGVPLEERDVRVWGDDLYAMVDAFGAVGPRHWEGRRARYKMEKRVEEIIHQIRKGNIHPPKNTAAHRMAFYHDLDDNPLPEKMAAIELINILRPIVAIATYITFGVLAFHEYPECKGKLVADEHYGKWFVQEIRRFYPFGPFLGARVRRDFTWHGYPFRKGTLVLLDIYGTNRDPRIWKNPETFMPERFKQWKGNPFDLIPQGGGDHYENHRCAGEEVTVQLMKTVLDFLAKRIDYYVPPQDLHYSLKKMPTLPKSGFIMENIREKPERSHSFS